MGTPCKLTKTKTLKPLFQFLFSDVTANSLHPGAVGTAMLMSEDSIWNKVLNLLFHFVTKVHNIYIYLPVLNAVSYFKCSRNEKL